MKNYILAISLLQTLLMCSCGNEQTTTSGDGESTAQFTVLSATLLSATRATNETSIADVNFYLVDQ